MNGFHKKNILIFMKIHHNLKKFENIIKLFKQISFFNLIVFNLKIFIFDRILKIF